ncbi:panB [Symbiodinium natans]|uniref:3-methyl-2-oxobutanoate hydroxymethyltransferase n=1 Tax=Symbiodinium natans TaxID=878477 RepID=A0A812PEU1_9DINO|nr:panB [Symbiodinium natans]
MAFRQICVVQPPKPSAEVEAEETKPGASSDPARQQLELLHPLFKRLVQNLLLMDSWAQQACIDILMRYSRLFFASPELKQDGSEGANRMSEDHEALVKNLKLLLLSNSKGVTLAAAVALCYLAPPEELSCVTMPLMRCFRQATPEATTTLLVAMAPLIEAQPGLFRPLLREFFVQSFDSSEVKRLKLEVIENLVDETNVQMVLRELQVYVSWHSQPDFDHGTGQLLEANFYSREPVQGIMAFSAAIRSMFLMYGSRHSSSAADWMQKSAGAKDPSRAGTGTDAAMSFDGIYGQAAVTRNGAEGKTGDRQDAAAAAPARPLGLSGLRRRFAKGQKLSMVTAYDFPSARFARSAGVELVLVGDSLGNCRLGLSDTVGVTMEDMLRATTAVRRGVDTAAGTSPKPLVIGDMPFGSYLTPEDALRNAAAFRVAGADIVKLEGGCHLAPLVKSLTNAGIGVMSHIGLEPQRALLQGGFRLQGTTATSAVEIVSAAKELVQAGAVVLVLEMVPEEVGLAVQSSLPETPVIGIGAGGRVAGQVLVCDDMLGVHGSPPSFAKMFADVGKVSEQAYATYVEEVRSGEFPGDKHSRRMTEVEREKLQGMLPEVQLVPPPAEYLQEVSDSAEAVPAPSASPAASRSQGAFGFEFLPGGRLLPVQRLAGPRRLAAGTRGIAQAATDSGYKPQLQQLLSNADLFAWRRRMSEQGRRVALVPTMGNLHEGHLELVDAALERADEAIVSIYVNPSQFASHEDLDIYPRTLEEDVQKLRERGATAVFTPLSPELYPTGSPGSTVVVPKFVEGKSEAADRPHFFSGVATVCLKFFNLVQPDVVIFGQKDAMQCVVIARMLEDLMLHDRITMHVVPTSREADGLARSSRNSYLTPSMRQKAPAIYRALRAATGAADASPGSVRTQVRRDLESQGLTVSYISVADTRFMDEKADEADLSNSVVSICCVMKEEGARTCRLLDNLLVPGSS